MSYTQDIWDYLREKKRAVEVEDRLLDIIHERKQRMLTISRMKKLLDSFIIPELVDMVARYSEPKELLDDRAASKL